MESTRIDLAHSSTIVVGSNGLIGSSIVNSITNALISQNLHFSSSVCSLSRDTFVADFFNSTLIQYSDHAESSKNAKANEFVFVLCFGTGGFSINAEIALEQSFKFKSFIEALHHFFPKARCIYISSFGALASRYSTPYRDLILSNEEYLSQFNSSLILRVPGVWGFLSSGPSQPLSPRGLISHLINSIYTLNVVSIYADLSTTRYYLHASTLAKAALKYIILLHDGSTFSEPLSLLPTVNYSINSLLSSISKSFLCNTRYTLNPGKCYDRDSHSFVAVDGSFDFIAETPDFRLLTCIPLH